MNAGSLGASNACFIHITSSWGEKEGVKDVQKHVKSI